MTIIGAGAMLIAERLLLLSLEPRSGTLLPALRRDLRSVLGAALLAELILCGRLAWAGEGASLDRGPNLPVAHPSLEELRLRLSRSAPLSVPRALRVAARRPPRLVAVLLEGMFRRDLLHRHRAWRGFRPAFVYPLRSRQPLIEAQIALRDGARDPSGSGPEALLAHLFLRLGGWSALPQALAAIGADPALIASDPARPQPPDRRWLGLLTALD